MSYIQRVSEAVASIIEAKEESWNDVPPQMDAPIHSIAIGLDGTYMLMCETGWREAMVGTISLYDKAGQQETRNNVISLLGPSAPKITSTISNPSLVTIKEFSEYAAAFYRRRSLSESQSTRAVHTIVQYYQRLDNGPDSFSSLATECGFQALPKTKS